VTFTGPLCAFLSSCTWAIGVSAYGRLARSHSGAAINTSRALVGLPLFLIASLGLAGGPADLAAQVAAVAPHKVGFLGLSILSSYALGDVLFLLSTRALGVPAALAIASTYPVWAAVAGVLFRGEALPAGRLAGVLTVVAGTVLVITSTAGARDGAAKGRTGARDGALVVGLLLALATSGLWALNSFSLSIGGAGVPVTVASAFRMVFALALCPPVGLVMGRLPGAPAFRVMLPWSALRPALPALLLETFAGTLLFTYGLAHSPLSIGAALSSLAPVLALPIAVLSGAERFSPVKTLGTSLCVIGVALLLLS
jgi:DME family drug/metabolite transporter